VTSPRDYSSFEFSPLLLPSDIDEGADASILRALGIYAQIKPEEFDATTYDGLNDMLYDLSRTDTFQVNEVDDPLILGVAGVEAPDASKDYLFVEGIAVHRGARGMELGVFIVDEIIKRAWDHDKVALEGNVRPSMEPYYEKRGWHYVEDAKNPQRMRLEID
jgi:GNAT superfamily N-acetyltransferase